MIIHKIVYGGVDLSDENALNTNIVIQDAQFTGTIRTQIDQNQNWHGGDVSPALGSNRLFTFTGKVFGLRAGAGNGQKILNNLLTIYDGFKELSFEDDLGIRYKTMAQVYGLPNYSANIDNDILDFRFELVSDKFEYFGYEDKIVRSEIGTFENTIGGEYLGMNLGNHLGQYKGLQVINNGNHIANCKIELIGEVVNPIIINGTNNRAYRINKTTNRLVLDNRGDKLEVQDIGVDIKAFRKTGSLSIYLNPGINEFVFLGENDFNGAKVNIFYNDTYK